MEGGSFAVQVVTEGESIAVWVITDGEREGDEARKIYACQSVLRPDIEGPPKDSGIRSFAKEVKCSTHAQFGGERVIQLIVRLGDGGRVGGREHSYTSFGTVSGV
jgi:hypothetical protein